GTFEAAVDEVLEPAPHLDRRVVEEQSDVPLVGHGAIESVGTVEGQTILARLHVLETERDLGLAHSHTELRRWIGQVEIPVSELREVQRIARRSAGEVRLKVDVDLRVDLPVEDHADAAEEETFV